MYVGSGACVNNRVIKTEHNIHNCFPIYVLNTLIKKWVPKYLITIDEEYYEYIILLSWATILGFHTNKYTSVWASFV